MNKRKTEDSLHFPILVGAELDRCPVIEINISCKGWPTESVLLQMTQSAVFSAINTAGLKIPGHAALSMLFADDAEICSLNSQFRNIQHSTNVLSFPGKEIFPGEMPDMILGDIALALQTVEREAILENKSFHHHLCHLIVHGFLHLFGYDHINAKEAMAMESLETRALAQLGIEDPYQEQ